MDEYALALKRKYGEGILEELKALKIPTSFGRKDYENVINKYKQDYEMDTKKWNRN